MASISVELAPAAHNGSTPARGGGQKGLRRLELDGPAVASYCCPVERLRLAGLRVTKQRAQLLTLLAESGQHGEHLDAESLYERAQEAGLEISLATVYRTLAVFQELGLVARHHFGHDASREYYEAAGTAAHHHFTCLRCGAVIEFQVPDVQSLCQELADLLDVQISQSSLYLQGLCSRCRQESSGA